MIADWFLRVPVETPPWAAVVSALALIIVLSETGIILLAAALDRQGRRFLERVPAAAPSGMRCAVIVPTRGLSRLIEHNLGTVLEQDWPEYQVYFAVESESDEGAPVLKNLCASHGNAHLVVAGKSVACSQKIHNLLAGVAAAGEVDLLAFADNDVPLPSDWLARLAASLSEPGVTMSTGFWRIRSRDSGFAVQLQIFFNRLLYTHFLAASSLGGGGFLWGGSFAIRRKDFEALGVAGRWAGSVSDDMSLGRLLAERGKRCSLIPGLVLDTEEAFISTREPVAWFSRQVMNLKANYYSLWRLGLMPLCFAVAGGYIVALLALLGCLLSAQSFWAAGGLAAVTVLGGELVIAACTVFNGGVEGRWKFLWRIHAFRLCFLTACLRTLGNTFIHWAGVTYRIDRQGRVLDIRR